MKKSKSAHYEIAMCAIVETDKIGTLDKLVVLETLMADKRLAEYAEEAEKNADVS